MEKITKRQNNSIISKLKHRLHILNLMEDRRHNAAFLQPIKQTDIKKKRKTDLLWCYSTQQTPNYFKDLCSSNNFLQSIEQYLHCSHRLQVQCTTDESSFKKIPCDNVYCTLAYFLYRLTITLDVKTVLNTQNTDKVVKHQHCREIICTFWLQLQEITQYVVFSS